MSFHKTKLGMYGANLLCDIDGYVPTEEDVDAFEFFIDHGENETHNKDGTLTPYGVWWRDEGFPEWKAAAIQRTKMAEKALNDWRFP